MTGRDSRAIRSSERRRQQRDALGALQREPLGRELAEHEREVGDDQRDADEGDPVPAAPSGRDPRSSQDRREVVGEGRGAERRGQEAGERDADLDGREEAVGSACRAATLARRACRAWPGP